MAKAKKAKITENMRIGDIVNEHPETIEVFHKHGFGCVTCPMAAMETLKQGAKVHGMDKKKISKFLKELNEKA